MRITLCDKVLKGDIPVYDIERDDAEALVYDWFDSKDFSESVFVCFESYRNLEGKELRNEQNSILVSHSWDDILDMAEMYFERNSHENVDFAVFEFEDYQNAFKYCIDLKESF